MALGDSTLNLISNMIDSAHSNLRNYHNQIDENFMKLNGNKNYQVFIENTDIGKDLNEKLLQLKSIGNDASDDVIKLLNTTDEFLENQKKLNRVAAEQKSYEKSNYENPSSDRANSSNILSTYASKTNLNKKNYSE